MGEVYRAHDPRLNRDVALKFLRLEFSADADRLQRFVREAQTLAALNHPNIAQIHGVEDAAGSDGSPVRALVMELVDGEDLSARLRRGPVPIDESLEIAHHIATALEAAHDQGIVHRDLKPANIKIRPDGSVKVLDFGLAKALSAEPSSSAASLANSPTFTSPAHTAPNVILGTAAYMSPEQARGKEVDKRTDIWAFGVVLYEMLTGQAAFRGETATDLLAAVVTREPDWRALPAAVPLSVQRLLRRCLEKDSRNRLRDIGEARIALADPGADDELKPAAIEVKPRRGFAALLPWAVALAGIAVGVAAWVARPAVERPLRRLELALPADASPQTVTLSPDGRQIAFRAGDRIVAMDLERLQSTAVVASAPPQRSTLFWSRDSQFIGYNDVDAKLWIVPASGGAARLVATIPETGQLMGATWTRENTIVLAVWRGNLYQVSASGGVPTRLLAIDPKKEVDFHLPVELPDGRIVVATHLVDSAERGLYRIEAVTSQQRELVLEGGFLPIGFVSGHLLLDRFDTNAGLWAVPFAGRLPIRVDDGFLVAPGATLTTTATDGSVLYSLAPDAPQARELVWVDREGHVESTIGTEQVDLATPTLSPDQQQVAFAARTRDNVDVWVHDVRRNVDVRVTTDTVEQGSPSWFPSGDRIAYSEGWVGAARIAMSRADGSSSRQELTGGSSPHVTRDGEFLLHAVDELGDTHLRISTISALGEVSAVTPFFKRRPEPSVHGIGLSPDGRWLAYTERAVGGALELYVTSFPDGEGRWPVAVGARSPVWIPTGELFFASGANIGPYTMMSAKIGGGNAPRIGTPIKLFDIPAEMFVTPDGLSFDATSDGRRFVMVRSRAPGSRTATRWVLVQNWLEEFKTRSSLDR